MAEPRRATPVPFTLAALLTALTAFGPLSTDLYLPSLPGLVAVFATDMATVQLTLSVFLIGFAVSQLVYGPVSDRFGRRPALLAGIGLFAAGTVACALAPTIETLIAARLVQAVGACSGPVLARAVLRDLAPPQEAARLLAYMSMAMAVAPAAGPVLGGVLTTALGWQANFWLLLGFALAMLAGTLLRLPETNSRRDPAATRPRRLIEAYASLLRDRLFVGYASVVAGAYSTIFVFISGSAFVLVEAMGLSPVAYGLCFGLAVLGYIAGAFGAGRLTRRLGLDRMIALGTAVMAAGAIVMAALAWAGVASPAAVLVPFVPVMAGVGLAMPNAVAGAVGPFPHMAGTASALLGFVQMTVAAAVGVAIGHAGAPDGRPMATGVVVTVALAAGGLHLLVRPQRRRLRATADDAT